MRNIYMNQEAVESFVRVIRYPRPALSEAARRFVALLPRTDRERVRLLDIGIGDGPFTIPILETWREAGGPAFHLDCLDKSEFMLDRLKERLRESSIDGDNIEPCVFDAERGLPPAWDGRRYGAATLTFVLQYIRPWRRLLKTVVNHLVPGGLFVTAEVIGAMREVDGYPSEGADPGLREFWHGYFRDRQEYTAWRPRIAVSDHSRVRDYLGTLGLRQVEAQDYLWDTQATWEEMCSWIAQGPVSSLADGLRPDQQDDLAHRRREWLTGRGIAISEPNRLRWGLRVYWLAREQ